MISIGWLPGPEYNFIGLDVNRGNLFCTNKADHFDWYIKQRRQDEPDNSFVVLMYGGRPAFDPELEDARKVILAGAVSIQKLENL